MITDAQIHLWEIDRPERPWPKPLRGIPQREGGFPAEQALAEMDAAGVDRVVIVPAVVAGDRNEYALDVVAKYPERFAIMGRIDIDDPASEGMLATWKMQPNMLGIRLSGGTGWKQVADGTLEWLWAGCERFGIPIMMLPEPAVLPAVAEVAERHPALTLVLTTSRSTSSRTGRRGTPSTRRSRWRGSLGST